MLCRCADRKVSWLRAVSGPGSCHVNRCKVGLTGTLALCSTAASLRSSAAEPSAMSQMTYSSVVLGSQPGVGLRRCLWRAPGLIAEVDGERFEWPVSTTDFGQFLSNLG